MNIAIQITCLLIEAADEGVELKVDGDALRVRASADIGTELRSRLRSHQTAIVERLSHEADHPDPFKVFIDSHCLFCAGEGMATPIAELDQAYLQWIRDQEHAPTSLVLLHKHLRRLGCEEILYQGALCWEHVCVHWPPDDSPPTSADILASAPEIKGSPPGDAECPVTEAPADDTELANPYSQTECHDCGTTDARLQNVYAGGTRWGFQLCWECFSKRYGVYPNRSPRQSTYLLDRARRGRLSVWLADGCRLLKISGPDYGCPDYSKDLANDILEDPAALCEGLRRRPGAKMIVPLPDDVQKCFTLTVLVREEEM